MKRKIALIFMVMTLFSSIGSYAGERDFPPQSSPPPPPVEDDNTLNA